MFSRAWHRMCIMFSSGWRYLHEVFPRLIWSGRIVFSGRTWHRLHVFRFPALKFQVQHLHIFSLLCSFFSCSQLIKQSRGSPELQRERSWRLRWPIRWTSIHSHAVQLHGQWLPCIGKLWQSRRLFFKGAEHQEKLPWKLPSRHC